MQVLDRSRLMAIPPIWRLGFRPFFLGGALFAVLAIALWLAALAGLWSGWQPVGGWPGIVTKCSSVSAWRSSPASC